MKLPFFGSFGKREVKNYFLALLLQDEKIGAVILEEIAGRIHVVSSSEEHFHTSLEKADFEEWLNIIDKAVSLAENNIQEEIQTEKTVFGVKQDWVIDGKIKKEYLLKLKKVCDELALEPIGFLVFTEAIIHLLQQEEGAPVSAILVEVGKKFLTISLIRAGRIIQTQLVPIQEKITIDVDNALKNFDTEILPARIILYDSENNEKLSQSFISHSWSKSLPFLHVPQITVLSPNFDIKGVLYGTAAQMGFEVFGEHAIPVRLINAKHEPLKPESQEPMSEKPTEEIRAEEPLEKGETTLQEEILQDEEITSEKEKETDKKPELETVDKGYFGFVENKDVSDVSRKELNKHQAKENGPGEIFEEIPEEVKEEETDFSKPTGALGTQSSLLFQRLKKGFSQLSKNTPKAANFLKTVFAQFKSRVKNKKETGENIPRIPFKGVTALLIILVLIIGAVLLYVFAVSATVTIAVTPKVIDEKTPVSFAVDGSSNFANNQIAAKTASQNESGNLSQDTTGTKQVGTPAKGSVTIFSRLTQSTTMPKGTIITASNGLKFSLDSDVSIASFSGDTSDPSITTSDVSVSAKDIGPEYNIPSGTKFDIDGQDKSNVSAKNDNPFSGGTKKDISVVSKDDVDKLTAALQKNFESTAQNDIKKTLSGTQELLPFFAKEDVVQKTLSKNIGDEAKSVSVDATVAYEGIIVDKNDLTTFATQALNGKLQGSDLTNNNIQTDLTDIKVDQNSISGNLAIKAFLLPKIDNSQLINSISGKSFGEAVQIIKNISQVSDAHIKLNPSLFFLPNILPRIGSHIHINTVTNE